MLLRQLLNTGLQLRVLDLLRGLIALGLKILRVSQGVFDIEKFFVGHCFFLSDFLVFGYFRKYRLWLLCGKNVFICIKKQKQVKIKGAVKKDSPLFYYSPCPSKKLLKPLPSKLIGALPSSISSIIALATSGSNCVPEHRLNSSLTAPGSFFS